MNNNLINEAKIIFNLLIDLNEVNNFDNMLDYYTSEYSIDEKIFIKKQVLLYINNMYCL